MKDLKRILKDLIAIPSVSPSIDPHFSPDGEAQVRDYLQDLLEAAGVATETYDVLPGRPNLLARLDFGKPETVVLSAHTDTVPARDWDRDPFDPVERDGLIFGRGSCDTKASLAVFVSVALEAARSRGCGCNLVFAAVCDEEAGFAGSNAAARRLTADLAIAGEPTGLQVVTRHKGVMRFVLGARGRSCHSATPNLGTNAIYPLARAVVALEEQGARWAGVTCPGLGERTLSVTLISGGQAVNVVPSSAEAHVDVRSLPGDTQEGLLEELRRVTDPDVEIRAPYLAGPALETSEELPLVARLIDASSHPSMSANYATDAAVYGSAGLPSVVFGPGDIALAHTKNESIPLAQMEAASGVLRRFLGLG